MWQSYLFLIFCCIRLYVGDATAPSPPLITKQSKENVAALEGKPEIVEPPGTTTTVNRRTVTLVCKIRGIPKPEVQWTKDGNILGGARFKVTHDENFEITNVRLADAGTYQCSASNKFGSEYANGTLVVKRATKIFERPENFEVAKEMAVGFSCGARADSDLELKIDWLKDGETIDFTDTRYYKWNNSDLRRSQLRISKIVDLDAGLYTCVAYTDLDRVEATARLIVLNVPNAPIIIKVACYQKVAVIYWQSQGDNHIPIKSYSIELNTSFTPNEWVRVNGYENCQSPPCSGTVKMNPWANYTFRVIAWNKMGQSLPSDVSQVCTTHQDVPHKNPENVRGKGTDPNNMVISWTPMNETEHNAPNFRYRISWKKDLATELWQHTEISNWNQSSLVISDTPVFQRYRIKVIALNEIGATIVQAPDMIGYSGEDRPTEPPGNFNVIHVTGYGQPTLEWTKVSTRSVNGHLNGYKIQLWTEGQPEQNREIHIKGNRDRYRIGSLTPATNYFAQVMVYNGHYNGPPSNIVSFTTP